MTPEQRYPQDYVDDEGWARIHRGHDLSRHKLWVDIGRPEEGQLKVEELHLREQRSVKWCERHGDACDLNGEWHTHWHGVQPTDSPECKFTVARWVSR